MIQRTEQVAPIKGISGWVGVGLMALGFIGLYLANYIIPLTNTNYTTRIWDWTELALAAMALVVILVQWRAIHARTVWIGAMLGIISGWSYLLDDSSLRGGVIEAMAVWLTFIAGTLLFQSVKDGAVTAFGQTWFVTVRNLGFGLLVAIPLAALNNFFFFLQNGAPRLQNFFASAAEALSPGIHEEAVFRYFILAVCLSMLRRSTHPRLVKIIAIAFAVVPHSLLHLPDLFLDNPVMAVAMLIATSLLFGLPMALLQIKRSFESAVVFHWFIDFIRFWFGY